MADTLASNLDNNTPVNIVAYLDQFIIGQADAKRNVAIALRNRWRRMQVPLDLRNDIIPNNILMIGATGIGKTEIARRLAKLTNAPFIKVEASKYTEVGYVGRDVESMVRDLAEQAINLVKAERREAVIPKALALVEDQLLNILIPPIKTENTDQQLNQSTRDLFRQKLKNADLETKEIEIDVPASGNSPSMGLFAPQGMDDATAGNLQDMLSGLTPKRTKKRKMTIADARKLLLEDEINSLIDIDDVKQEAILRAENNGIIFIDEIDKIAQSSNANSSSGNVSREGVQRDLLPIVEGSAVNTRYGLINTDHILFIAAGAFHFSKPSDLIPELQGRFPIRVELSALTSADFYQILVTTKTSLIKQYQALFMAEGITLSIEDDAILLIADIAHEVNQQLENIGARRLQTVLSHLLNSYLYDAPEGIPAGTTLVITKLEVEEKLNPMLKNKDLSQYIL